VTCSSAGVVTGATTPARLVIVMPPPSLTKVVREFAWLVHNGCSG
jgi:hypothetical protein